MVQAAETQRDLAGIRKIDRANSTDRIYRVRRSELGLWLDEEPVSPPVHKVYRDPSPELSERLLVAAAGAEILGYGELRFNSWNDRAESRALPCQVPFGVRTCDVSLFTRGNGTVMARESGARLR